LRHGLPRRNRHILSGAGQWQKKSPAELGMDAAKLQQAIEYAQAHGSTWDSKRTKSALSARCSGRCRSNARHQGIILRHGYIVAEFGDTKAMIRSTAWPKVFLSTVCGLAVAQGLIQNVNDPVAKYIHDGGYDSPHNAR